MSSSSAQPREAMDAPAAAPLTEPRAASPDRQGPGGVGRGGWGGRRALIAGSIRKHNGKLWYLALSGVSFGVSFGLTTLLHEAAGLPETPSLAITLVCVMIMNFFTLRHLVYKATHGSIWRQFRGFVAMAACFRGIEVLAFALAVDVLGVQYQIALVCIQGTMAVCKYLAGGKLVFHGRRPPAQAEAGTASS